MSESPGGTEQERLRERTTGVGKLRQQHEDHTGRCRISQILQQLPGRLRRRRLR